MNYEDIIHFWFIELSPKDWWVKNLDLDKQISDRFLKLLDQAKMGELYQWRAAAQGRLAEIIVLDQFSRNIYRDTAESFSADAQALTLAQEAVAAGYDKELDNDTERAFLYMPYMHSESLIIQEESLRLFKQLETEDNYLFAVKHYDIIRDYGRYPHRNRILGRTNTEAEDTFFANGGTGF